ncbi:TlpA disulfide reductase family protein [Actinokineospora globicatena]|uniref:TlpA disulfide reductase family protein n=1 Tax=Actinokineospora globicatena TaxID=103729 RepID=UPI0020A45D4B|nr:TlpA disulfide reductase family protein [Actinokineospora globicatena]MCP2301712.1 Thiol-disulfide isomerase or thioredoxin [Actinokineospora globicatena]GLW76631.1 thioredoxin [Actinokineospora globicatena]GLW83465.1 thioredoxin [Actinokineospora globicatena]
MRWVVLAAVVGLVAAGCGTTEPPRPNGALVPVGARDVVVEVSGEELLTGAAVATRDLDGTALVVNVWGAWCAPCRHEFPQLQRVHAETRELDVDFLGIDVRDNDREFAVDFVRDRQVEYPSLYDPAARSLLGFGKYRNATVPSTFVLDKQHRVAAVFYGGVLADELLPRVREVAAEASS